MFKNKKKYLLEKTLLFFKIKKAVPK